MGLKSNLISLYMAIKRCAGENGQCIKSRKKLCEEAGIGIRNFPKFKSLLCETQKLIKKPLIRCNKRFNEEGDQDTDQIIIVDIWPENNFYFQNKNRGGAKLHGGGAKLHGGVVQNCMEGGAKLHAEEQPIKKNLFKKIVLCPTPLVGESDVKKNKKKEKNVGKAENAFPDRCVKKTPKGVDIHISLQDIFTLAVQKRTDWDAKEITEAWKRLLGYSQPIRDWEAFVQGVIENIRIEKNINKLKSKDKRCKRMNSKDTDHMKMPSNDGNTKTSESVTREKKFPLANWKSTILQAKK